MFVIEATNAEGWRWISAVCREREPAEAFLAAIPDGLKDAQRLVEVPRAVYPLFVIEDRGFEYGGAEMVRERLARTQPSGNEDDVHFNVYLVGRDFKPAHPGKDFMGSIRHWHIDDELIVSGQESFLSELQEAERRAA